MMMRVIDVCASDDSEVLASWGSRSSTTRSSCCWVPSSRRLHVPFRRTWCRASALMLIRLLQAFCSTSSTWRGCSKDDFFTGGHRCRAGARRTPSSCRSLLVVTRRRVPHVVLACCCASTWARRAVRSRWRPPSCSWRRSLAVPGLLLPEGDERSAFWFYFPREAVPVLDAAVRRRVVRFLDDEATSPGAAACAAIALALRGCCGRLGLLMRGAGGTRCVFLLPDPDSASGRAPTLPSATSPRTRSCWAARFCACRDAVRVALAALRAASHARRAAGRRSSSTTNLLAVRHGATSLSERECEVLRYVLLGKDNQNIASVHAPGAEHREGARAQHPAEDGPVRPPSALSRLLEDGVGGCGGGRGVAGGRDCHIP